MTSEDNRKTPNRKAAERANVPPPELLTMTPIPESGPQPPSGRQFSLSADDFDYDDADWYIMLRAHELGLDPHTTVTDVRAALKKRRELVSMAAAPVEIMANGPSPALARAESLAWPPGFAGAIARYLHSVSYSPIPEVSIIATLGLLAGVCGRAYRTFSGKDLALYLILVAKSGVGKDHIHEAIPLMLRLAKNMCAVYFCRAQDFASGEALHKEVLRGPGFLYLQGEFGRKLKRMSNPQDAPMQSFRTTMTNAFGKEYLEGKSYSRAEDSVLGVEWPALSFLGETTPGTYFECLNEDMMADGFLSRFLVVSYSGDRPLPNRTRDAAFPTNSTRYWSALVDHAVKYQPPINAPTAMLVQVGPGAAPLVEAFELQAIDNVNATDVEADRQVWSRAHLKMLKLASLLAVADNYIAPVVGAEHVRWAMSLVQLDIATFQSRQRNGDVGTGDDARERKVASVVRDYIVLKAIPPGYKVPPAMHKDGVVSRSYLMQRVQSLPMFKNHKLDVSKALDETLRSMCANGWLMECNKTTLQNEYGHAGKAFRVMGLPD